MRLAIMGRGSVAQALSRALADHDISLGVRTPSAPGEATMEDAAAAADAVILATPWSAEEEVASVLAGHVAGKPVIDATNPVGMTNHGLGLVSPPGRSAAEILQERLPGAHVVKCFNQIGAEYLAEPGRLASPPVMFAAGDDTEARGIALLLARAAGFDAASAGPLSNARHLESLAMLWIWSAMKGDLGRSFGFALARERT